MKVKKNNGCHLPTWLADCVKETCKLLLTKGSIGDIESYAQNVKLPYDNCPVCSKSTPTIECEEYTVCGICLKDKPRNGKLF